MRETPTPMPTSGSCNGTLPSQSAVPAASAPQAQSPPSAHLIDEKKWLSGAGLVWQAIGNPPPSAPCRSNEPVLRNPAGLVGETCVRAVPACRMCITNTLSQYTSLGNTDPCRREPERENRGIFHATVVVITCPPSFRCPEDQNEEPWP